MKPSEAIELLKAHTGRGISIWNAQGTIALIEAQTKVVDAAKELLQSFEVHPTGEDGVYVVNIANAEEIILAQGKLKYALDGLDVK